MSSTPFILSSLSFSKYMSLLWRSTNQRRFQFRRDSVDEPPPFLCSQPCFRASCLARNHRKVSSFRTHQRRFHVFIRPPGEENMTFLLLVWEILSCLVIESCRFEWIDYHYDYLYNGSQTKTRTASHSSMTLCRGFVFQNPICTQPAAISCITTATT